MKIALDIDAVLADFLSEFLHWRNKRFGTRWQRQDFWSYDWHVVFAEERRTLNAVLFDFFHSREIARIRPMPGAQRAVKKLKNLGHELSVITSRPRLIADLTADWLERNFKSAFETVYFSNNPEWHSFGPDKGQIANAWGAELFVDDQSQYCRESAREGIPALLFDSPWNQKDELPENVYRVIVWRDAVRIVKEIGG